MRSHLRVEQNRVEDPRFHDLAVQHVGNRAERQNRVLSHFPRRVFRQQKQLGNAELAENLRAQDGRSVVEENAGDDAVFGRRVQSELDGGDGEQSTSRMKM